MSTGTKNKLTGQIGEHLVSAILGTFGFYASPYSGNVPGFDITAVDSETLESFPIQVKTSNGGAIVHSTIDKWAEHEILENNVQQIGDLLPLDHPDKIWVMVQLQENDLRKARFFVCKEWQIQEKIVAAYTAFMKKHNFRRPRGGASLQAILTLDDVLEFEDGWEILNPQNY